VDKSGFISDTFASAWAALLHYGGPPAGRVQSERQKVYPIRGLRGGGSVDRAETDRRT
jgi:hypothetical protein